MSYQVYTSAKSSKSLIQDAINIVGIGFDSSTSFRPGSRFAPNAIREASYQMEEYSPYLDRDLADKEIYDLGNLPQQTLIEYHQKDFDTLIWGVDLSKTKILTLGGDHSISSLPIFHYLRAFPDLTIVHLDAHTDLRDDYLNNKMSHACVMRRVFENFKEDHRLLQYGVRSGTKEEFLWMKENKTLAPSKQILFSRLAQIVTPIYLTLDVDFFDPSICLGTGTPEAGGSSFQDFLDIMQMLDSLQIVGADVVELSPQIDSSGNSSCFVSQVVREILLSL